MRRRLGNLEGVKGMVCSVESLDILQECINLEEQHNRKKLRRYSRLRGGADGVFQQFERVFD